MNTSVKEYVEQFMADIVAKNPGGAAAVRAEVFLPFALGLLEGCAACPAPTLLNLFSMPLTKGFDGWDRNFQKL